MSYLLCYNYVMVINMDMWYIKLEYRISRSPFQSRNIIARDYFNMILY